MAVAVTSVKTDVRG
ncbi:hypothetical protein A2U01_0104735, partial [Trifolium medium]|nr:hypothetical protein [Trifolium medium]